MRFRGFTLIELMIVIAIIAIIAAIAIPSLLENQKAANDNAAQAMLRTLITAQTTYNVKYKRYAPSLSALSAEYGVHDNELANCTAPGLDSLAVNNYIYQMTAGKPWSNTAFYVRCRPAAVNAGIQSFAMDVTGAVVTTANY